MDYLFFSPLAPDNTLETPPLKQDHSSKTSAKALTGSHTTVGLQYSVYGDNHSRDHEEARLLLTDSWWSILNTGRQQWRHPPPLRVFKLLQLTQASLPHFDYHYPWLSSSIFPHQGWMLSVLERSFQPLWGLSAAFLLSLFCSESYFNTVNLIFLFTLSFI